MALDEGVIKFNLEYNPVEAFSFEEIEHMQAVRNRLFQAYLIGGKNKEPAVNIAKECYSQYTDVCYGNISMRVPPYKYTPKKREFIITGTQTGCLEMLTEEHYTLVKEYYPSENKIVSEGPIEPSSESMTHGMIYDRYHEARAVIHVHSPHLWKAAKEEKKDDYKDNRRLLNIPRTNEDAPYGTPAMAAEVKRILKDKLLKKEGLLFSMDGHEDGIVAFADTLEKAEVLLMRELNKAYELVGKICDWK